MHVTQRYGSVISTNGKRKFVSREKPFLEPLKGDGYGGYGEVAKSVFGGKRRCR